MAIGRLAPCVRIGRVSRFPPPRGGEERSVRGILPLAWIRERERVSRIGLRESNERWLGVVFKLRRGRCAERKTLWLTTPGLFLLGEMVQGGLVL